MSGFNLGAFVVAFIALLFLANLGSSILTDWQTPASNGAPVAGSLPAPAVEAQPVTLPGNPQPVALMPVPATTPPPPSGNPGRPLAP